MVASKPRRLTINQKIAIVVPIIVALLGIVGSLLISYIREHDGNEISNIEDIEYVGRVLNADNQLAIVGAKISLDMEGVPPIVYTDSEGIYRFSVASGTIINGQVRVDASGFQPYTRNISLSSGSRTIEDIRLLPDAKR